MRCTLRDVKDHILYLLTTPHAAAWDCMGYNLTSTSGSRHNTLSIPCASVAQGSSSTRQMKGVNRGPLFTVPFPPSLCCCVGKCWRWCPGSDSSPTPCPVLKLPVSLPVLLCRQVLEVVTREWLLPDSQSRSQLSGYHLQHGRPESYPADRFCTCRIDSLAPCLWPCMTFWV